jgi:hypothetical protein
VIGQAIVEHVVEHIVVGSRAILPLRRRLAGGEAASASSLARSSVSGVVVMGWLMVDSAECGVRY